MRYNTITPELMSEEDAGYYIRYGSEGLKKMVNQGWFKVVRWGKAKSYYRKDLDLAVARLVAGERPE